MPVLYIGASKPDHLGHRLNLLIAVASWTPKRIIGSIRGPGGILLRTRYSEKAQGDYVHDEMVMMRDDDG